MTTKYNVSSGPSKHAVSVAFFTKIDGHRYPVEFQISPLTQTDKWSEIQIVINEMRWEDGSGESWCFYGYATRYGWAPRSECKINAVRGYFRTDRRDTGWIEVTSDSIPVL